MIFRRKNVWKLTKFCRKVWEFRLQANVFQGHLCLVWPWPLNSYPHIVMVTLGLPLEESVKICQRLLGFIGPQTADNLSQGHLNLPLPWPLNSYPQALRVTLGIPLEEAIRIWQRLFGIMGQWQWTFVFQGHLTYTFDLMPSKANGHLKLAIGRTMKILQMLFWG